MKTSQNLPNYILLILYIITGSLTNNGAIDILAPQWVYLGSINILTCLFFLFNPNSFANTGLSKLLNSSFIYVYLFYFIWSGMSYFYAINSTETLLNIPRVGNTFFAVFFCFLLLHNLENKIQIINRIFLGFLLFELSSFYSDFFTELESPSFSTMNLKGVAGNKNITSASIAFKIPFVLYSLITASRKLVKAILFIMLFLAAFAVSVLYARSAILSSSLVFFIFIIFLTFTLFGNKNDRKKNLANIGLTLTPYLLAVLVNIFFTGSQNKGNIGSQLGDIEFTEQSSNGRFQYWGDAFDYITDNPVIASGLGNWKIASISYGKEHVKGYTVPYHAHNDFIHVFAEVGILGGIAYLSLFLILTFYLFRLLYVQRKEDGNTDFSLFLLILPFIIYGIDAGLNFPVARPLMQSSLALYMGLLLSIYLNRFSKKDIKPLKNSTPKLVFGLSLCLLVPGLVIHVLSFQSLKQQGVLLYEFNSGKFNLSLSQLEEIEDDFPNLTETAMPIKAMKARYFYLNNLKEKGHEYAKLGSKDNPQIYFGENLRAQFFLQEQKIDSAYHYSKLAFFNLPNNMPHYNIYMNAMTAKKDREGINAAFEHVRSIAGDTAIIWVIYLRALAQISSLGDPFVMDKASKAFKLYPSDKDIFNLYRILTYGQQRVVQAQQLYKSGTESYNASNFEVASGQFKEAFDLDPLEYTYALNSGLALYQNNQLEEAIRYFDITQSSRKTALKEKALRYMGLSLYKIGKAPEACAVFLKLMNTYPKRMYQQEFQKYCRN